jgi:hypothetical protein
MGVNSTDIFYDQSKSIPHGIESEHAWGVLLHRTRRIGISGNDSRDGVNWKCWEVLERRKKVILLHLCSIGTLWNLWVLEPDSDFIAGGQNVLKAHPAFLHFANI